MQKKLFLLFFVLVTCSCAIKPPVDAFRLNQSSLADKQRQMRSFNTKDELALLSAGISVLQDLGYNIDETEKKLGMVTASKSADARDTKQQVGMLLLAILANNPRAMEDCDKEQKIRVSFITKPSRQNKNKHLARVTFQRIIWNNAGKVNRVETIKDDIIYKDFFEKLSKSVFLEANKI